MNRVKLLLELYIVNMPFLSGLFAGNLFKLNMIIKEYDKNVKYAHQIF